MLLSRPDSKIVGGRLISGENFIGDSVGTGNATPTIIFAGIEPSRLELLHRLQTEAGKLQDELESLLNMHGKEYAESLIYKAKDAIVRKRQGNLKKLNLIKDSPLYSKFDPGFNYTEAFIAVRGRIFSGTKLRIGNISTTLEEDAAAIRFSCGSLYRTHCCHPLHREEKYMFVKLWMHTEVITLQPEDTISEACSLMEKHNIRRIPVIDPERRLLGIISKEDIKKALPSVVDASLDDTTRALANQVKVAAFMTQKPITVQPTDTLEKIATLMLKNKIGGIPVIENDLLTGIITESDIFRAFVQILGGDNKDIRIELCLSHDNSALYNMFELLNAYGAQINNIAICNNHSPQTRSITLRITSNQSQAIVDELWKMGCKISSIITDN